MQGKIALITGGGTGIGRAIALLLAQSGVDIALNYSRSEEDASKTCQVAHAGFVTGQTIVVDGGNFI